MNKSQRWNVEFEENGGEYTGNLFVTAKDVHFDEVNENAFWVDRLFIELDERILSIKKLPNDDHV